MTRKLYISGPMSGIEKFNYPAFEKAAQRLRSEQYDVLSAHEVNHDAREDDSWEGFLRRDLIEMLQHCTDIVLLEGWQLSKGSRLELHIAQALSMDVYFFNTSEDAFISACFKPHPSTIARMLAGDHSRT